jgi:CBS domain containing-hemolysin-like protein
MGRVSDESFDLKALVRSPEFIPASSSLGDALRRMQASRVHFVFVVDEHGGMDGILTLEDLLEEIVGDIDDEYDEEVREQIKRDGETYILDGMLAVRDANKHFGLALAEDGRYTTIAGFLLDKAGRLLRPGDRVEDVAGVFSVERVENRRISRVRFQPTGGR